MDEDEPVLDLDVAQKLLPGGPDFIPQVAAMTCQELPAQLEKARDALDAGDLGACRWHVHSFQTAIRSFGSAAAMRVSAAIMTSAHAGDLEATRAAFPSLEAAIVRFLAALGEIGAPLEE